MKIGILDFGANYTLSSQQILIDLIKYAYHAEERSFNRFC